ncbi:MAG: hypothetical protein AAGC56_06210 [Pseudomonadota bacterium]
MTLRLILAGIAAPAVSLIVAGALCAILPLGAGQAVLVGALVAPLFAAGGALYCFWAPTPSRAARACLAAALAALAVSVVAAQFSAGGAS